MLFVSDGKVEGKLHFISLNNKEIVKSVKVGHTPGALALTPDGEILITANRFSNTVSVIDLVNQERIKDIEVERDPINISVSPDGQIIAVANHLPGSASTDQYISSKITLIDRNSLEVIRNIELANGSQSIKGLAFSNDGKFLYSSHILSRYKLPTSQIENGWINSNAISIIDIEKGKYVTSFLLDNYNKGAANPAEIKLSEGGQQLIIALAGVHELCFIDLPKLHAKLEYAGELQIKNFSNDLLALNGIKHRKSIGGKSPRHLGTYFDKLYVSSYFSPYLEIYSVSNLTNPGRKIFLGDEPAFTPERLGELYFYDANLCFQKWQSCISCHPDARADGLNWDLLNDGAGNPKNTKSLLYAHFTPPAMITGIRDKAETAVRSGIKYILFSQYEESVADAIDSYIKSLKAVPSPYLVKGNLSKNALKGKKIFETAGCIKCHSGKYYTDMQKYDVGTGAGEHINELFDVPVLTEIWRTAPYLYDGRAQTIKEVLTEFNKSDEHGITSTLSDKEIELLEEFILSL